MCFKTFFFNFCLIFIEADINWYKTVKFYVLNESRSILLDPLKYTIENQKIWSFFSIFDNAITESRNLGASFLVCQKLLMIFQIWVKFHFICLSISDFNWGKGGFSMWFFFTLSGLIIFMVYWEIAYSEPCQTPKMELFAKIVTSKGGKTFAQMFERVLNTPVLNVK